MSQTIPCPVCHDETPDGLLCRKDTAKLTANLRALPELMDELAIDRRRQSRKGTTGGKGTGVPLQFGFEASWTHEAVIGTITTWIRELAESAKESLYVRTPVECVCRPPWKLTTTSCPGRHVRIDFTPGDTMESWCAWLIKRIPRIRGHVSVEQIVDELENAAHTVKRAIDQAAELEYVCLCPVCGKGVYGPADAKDDVEVTCKECRRVTPRDDNGRLTVEPHTFNVGAERIRRLDALRDSVLPERELLTAVKALRGEPLSQHTFRSWVRRYETGVNKAHIAPIGCWLIWDDEGEKVIGWKPAYWVDEAMRLAAKIPAKHGEPQQVSTHRRIIRKNRMAS